MIENFVFLVTIDDNDKFILFFLVYKCCAAGEYFLTPSFNTAGPSPTQGLKDV